MFEGGECLSHVLGSVISIPLNDDNQNMLLDLSELPIELVPHIIRHVHNKQDLYSLQTVCKTFFLPATRQLYTETGPIPLNSAHLRRLLSSDPERVEIYKALLKRCRISVTRVVSLNTEIPESCDPWLREIREIAHLASFSFGDLLPIWF